MLDRARARELQKERVILRAATTLTRVARGFLARRKLETARREASGLYEIHKQGGGTEHPGQDFMGWRLKTSLGGGALAGGFNMHMAREGSRIGVRAGSPEHMVDAAGALVGVVIVATAEDNARQARVEREGARRRIQAFEQSMIASGRLPPSIAMPPTAAMESVGGYTPNRAHTRSPRIAKLEHAQLADAQIAEVYFGSSAPTPEETFNSAAFSLPWQPALSSASKDGLLDDDDDDDFTSHNPAPHSRSIQFQLAHDEGV